MVLRVKRSSINRPHMASFHIQMSVRGAYRYVLREGNNKVMLWGCGEHYLKIACQSGIMAVKVNAGNMDRYVRTDIPGYHWFSLNANGVRLCLSETYTEAADRDQGLSNVMKSAPGADTVDLT